MVVLNLKIERYSLNFLVICYIIFYNTYFISYPIPSKMSTKRDLNWQVSESYYSYVYILP